jgi:hypothetical protein
MSFNNVQLRSLSEQLCEFRVGLCRETWSHVWEISLTLIYALSSNQAHILVPLLNSLYIWDS